MPCTRKWLHNASISSPAPASISRYSGWTKKRRKTMNDLMQPLPGLDVWHPATQQAVFRRLLDCYSHPGRVEACGDTDRAPLTALLATLLDAETSLADPHHLIKAGDWPKLEVRSGTAEHAAFVVANGTLAADFTPRLGTLESPEQSATLLLLVNSLVNPLGNEQARSGGQCLNLKLSGPGIPGTLKLAVSGLHPGWLSARADWVAVFPLGVDLILCDSRGFTALPRTTHIELEVC
ncbi:MAG: phosphonate C-P lyase system protein PhnH [Gallionellales bacterium 39-52-133]|nr:MAG: phosphonate C-P lyase system protein PhnH [Gallionellales bacterium 39-52-133]